MYRLKSSHISNEKYYNRLESDLELQSRFKTLDFNTLSEIIFHDEITPSVYSNAVCALTVSDSSKIPLLFSEARYLFFALQVNRLYYEKNTGVKINSLSQAKLMYDETGNSFTEMALEQSDNARQIRFERFMARHRIFFPNCNLYWEIPISFYKDGETGQTCVTPAGNVNPYALVSIPAIDSEKFKIPRNIYLKFFLGQHSKLVCNTTKDIALNFNQLDNELALHALEFCGYSKRYTILKDENTDYYYDNESRCLVAELLHKDSKVFNSDESNEEEAVYWSKMSYNKYFFMKNHKEYVPVLRGDTIEIYMR